MQHKLPALRRLRQQMGPLTPDTPCSTGPSWGQKGADRRNSLNQGILQRKREPLAARYFSICLRIQGPGRSPATSAREMRLPSRFTTWQATSSLTLAAESGFWTKDAGLGRCQPPCPAGATASVTALDKRHCLDLGPSQSRPWDKNLGPSSLEVSQGVGKETSKEKSH